MPLGIVSNEEFEKEINQVGEGVIKDINRGRGEQKEVPEIVRQIVGEDALENGSKESLENGLAKYLGISASSVSAYKKGAHSTSSYNEPNKNLKGRMNTKKKIIVSKARSVLTRALTNITDDKLENTKPVELSQIAKNMSAVIRDMEPSDNRNNGNTMNQQIIVYAPKMLDSMDQFPIIEARE